MGADRSLRVVVAWCPDWPVTAAGHAPDEPVAVLEHGRVLCASREARRAGVRLDCRRREAESRCSDLVVLDRDPAAEARAYEPALLALGALAPRVEVVRPGICALDARGAAHYAGGEAALVSQVAALVDGAVPPVGPGGAGTAPPTGVGIADGYFAATLAAHLGRIVAPGGSADFLAPFPIGSIGRPALVDLLVRLGIETLGDLAALDPATVSARFGPEGAEAQRRARGDEDRRLAAIAPAEELVAWSELDPPVDRLEVAVFAARSVAGELADGLRARGLVCTRVTITAESEHAERSTRAWRGEEGGGITAPAMVERLRWQLEGWFGGTAGEPVPTAGLTLLRLEADEVAPSGGVQEGFWGGASEADHRAARALDRLRGVLGPEEVMTGVPCGGRGPAERFRLEPWGEHPGGGHPSGEERRSVAAPWPGRHPSPAPTLVHPRPPEAEVVDQRGNRLGVSGRGRLNGEPARLSVAGVPWQPVVAWAGPWLVDERWWDPRGRRRRARFQLVTADGSAHLCAVEQGRWWVEATYD